MSDDDDVISYSVQLIRKTADGSSAVINIDNYRVLSELLDAVMVVAAQQGWIKTG